MYVLVCVLDNPSHLTVVLDGWTKAGVPGITVLESTGFQRVKERLRQPSAPLFLGFNRLLCSDQYCHNTLFGVVEDMQTVQRAVAATEAIVGDLSRPHTGILFALPVEAAWGIAKQPSRPAQG